MYFWPSSWCSSPVYTVLEIWFDLSLFSDSHYFASKWMELKWNPALMHKSLSMAFLQHSICFSHNFWNARRGILERWIKWPNAATPKYVLWDIYKLALQVYQLWSEVQSCPHVGVINAVMKYDLTSNLRWLRWWLIFRQEINELQSQWYIQWV